MAKQIQNTVMTVNHFREIALSMLFLLLSYVFIDNVKLFCILNAINIIILICMCWRLDTRQIKEWEKQNAK